jgi:hypothetical protein
MTDKKSNSADVYMSYADRLKEEKSLHFENDMRRTEFKSAALEALASASTAEAEIAIYLSQKANTYALLELARVTARTTGKTPPKK